MQREIKLGLGAGPVPQVLRWILVERHTDSVSEQPPFGVVAGCVQPHMFGEELHDFHRDIDGSLTVDHRWADIYAATVDVLNLALDMYFTAHEINVRHPQSTRFAET